LEYREYFGRARPDVKDGGRLKKQEGGKSQNGLEDPGKVDITRIVWKRAREPLTEQE
jgi:hypothetical protein